MNSGKLYIVPTPVGNLKDITFRAIEVLKEVDKIYAEDTRVTSVLLHHFDIKTPLQSYHSRNEHGLTPGIIQALQNGLKAALVSDAGTPCISDPGFLLVRDCVANQIPVECLPGPVAFVPALVQSGFPMHSFRFVGFLPHKKGRQTQLLEILSHSETTILYESPHRLLKLLESIYALKPQNTHVSVSREISKIYAETITGHISEVLEYFKIHEPRGEIVVIIHPGEL